jgi:hypothetical protein
VAILRSHLLGQLAAPANAAVAVAVAGCALYAAACSMPFAVDKYLGTAKTIRPSADIWLRHLRDREETDDFLAGVKGLHRYGKSLLYLVSRALDDERKMPLLGLECAVVPGWERDSGQCVASQRPSVQPWQVAFKGRAQAVQTPSVVVNKHGQTVPAQQGSFDNNVALIPQTIERVRGAKIVQPIEWLDY